MIQGTIKLMFQPAEEIMMGATDMINAGVLKNPNVDAGMMLHIMPAMPVDNGTIIINKTGKAMSSVDWFRVHVYGKNGHGSTPHAAIDPLIPAANILLALNEIQSRELPADALVALTVGQFHAGNTGNVIPAEVMMEGTLRTYDEDQRNQIKERMQQITENVAEAYRCKGELEIMQGAPTLLNDPGLTEHVINVLPSVLGKEKVMDMSKAVMEPVMASEDFAYVSQEVPIVMLPLTSSDARLSEPYPVHHPKLVIDETIFPTGVAAFVGTALSWLSENK